jgi:hypothetical protein
MSQIHDGTPPQPTVCRVEVVSLRDQFAMAALPALIRLYASDGPDLIATYAYGHADAMLKIRGAQ